MKYLELKIRHFTLVFIGASKIFGVGNLVKVSNGSTCTLAFPNTAIVSILEYCS